MGRRSTWLRYGFALAAAIAAVAIRRAFDPVWGHSLPYLLSFPAVMFAAWYGGFGPGVLATVVSLMTTWVFWVAPELDTTGIASAGLGVAVFGGTGVAVSLVCEALLTARARAEAETAAAQRANERLRVAQAYADAGVWDWDLASGQLYTSPELDALFEARGETSTTRAAFLERVDEEDRDLVGRELDALANGKQERLDVLFRVRSPERVRWLRSVGRGERDASGKVVRLAGIAIDVTENVLARERLAEKEKLLRESGDAKDRLIAMLSHELRNPVHAIASAVGLQEHASGRDVEASARARDVITRQVRHLERILADMLDVTRAVSGKMELRPEPVDLGMLARKCLETLHTSGRTAMHDIRTSFAEVWVDGDPTRLDQVVTNLVTNAVKYTPDGRTIHVEVNEEGGSAVLRVRDEGAGMSVDLCKHVFEPFVQGEQTLDRSQGGLGVGLALVHRIVELHRGSVSAESPGVGRGSTFVVRIPARRAMKHPTSASHRAKRAPRRVLVVEDHEDSREMLKTLLEAEGHEVREASDGRMAVEEALSFGPDVVLLDVGLPVFDGFEAARRIRAGGGTMRLVALTGYGQAEDIARSRAAGFDEHLVKPIDSRRVSEAVQAAAVDLTPEAAGTR